MDIEKYSTRMCVRERREGRLPFNFVEFTFRHCYLRLELLIKVQFASINRVSVFITFSFPVDEYHYARDFAAYGIVIYANACLKREGEISAIEYPEDKREREEQSRAKV